MFSTDFSDANLSHTKLDDVRGLGYAGSPDSLPPDVTGPIFERCCPASTDSLMLAR